VPPAGPNDPVELDTVASHRPAAGAVTLVVVEAELPQAALNPSARNSRDGRTPTVPTDAHPSPQRVSQEVSEASRDRGRVVQFTSPAEHILSNPLRSRPFVRGLRQLCLLAPLLALTACTGNHSLVPRQPLAQVQAGISWLAPELDSDESILARWRAGVGSPLVAERQPSPARSDALTVVSWNIALGAGEVIPYVRELQSSGHTAIVLLIQEAFRSGDDIPEKAECAFAGFLGDSKPDREIDAIAEALGFSLYYVPSMRNGAPGRFHEDRGNAILTNLDLDELVAIELPFERQRRVAVAATVRGQDADGDPWSLRLVSAHLDNTGSMRRLWIGGEYGRVRQARGLRDALHGQEPVLIGGDFNTWFGFSDRAYQELARAYPQTTVTDTRRTFRGLLRLDHVFYRVPPEWSVSVRRGETSRGSDHHPLVATVNLAAATSSGATENATEDTENTDRTSTKR
jgi:endonuclease/exonuclease/phosphatase family metal-dependent hydrolase